MNTTIGTSFIVGTLLLPYLTLSALLDTLRYSSEFLPGVFRQMILDYVVHHMQIRTIFYMQYSNKHNHGTCTCIYKHGWIDVQIMNSLEAKCWMVSIFLARIFRVVLYYLVLHGTSLVEYVFYLDWESCHWRVPVPVSFLFTRGDEFDEEFPVVSASVAFYRQRQTLAILLQVDISNVLQINLQENQIGQLVSIYITLNFSQNVVENLQFWPISSLFEWSYLGAVHICR